MTNSWIRWSQHYINSGSASEEVKSVAKDCWETHLSFSPPAPQGWTIMALNAAPSWNWYADRSLAVGEGGERAGGCHGDTRRWRERIVHSGWHGTSCSVLSGSLSRLICVSVGSVQATELHWSGSLGLTLQGCFKLGKGVTFLDGSVCGSASIYSTCICVSNHGSGTVMETN